MFKKFVTLLLTTVLVLSTSVFSFAGETEDSYVKSDSWMQWLPDDAPIVEINMPGTHDAACCYFRKKTAEDIITTPFAKTQGLSIPDQLNAGVRYMDCRICLVNENDGFLTVPHNMTITTDKKDNGEIMKIDTIIAYAEEFVKAHPTETVVLMIANDTRTYDKYMDKFYELKEQLVDSFKDPTNTNRVFLDTENSITSPTVKEMRGKVALILSGDIVGVSHGVDETGKWKWQNTIEPYFDSVVAQNYNSSVVMNKANGTSSRPITVNTSCTGINSHIVPAPDDESSVMNNYIMNYGLAKGKFLGWFQSDYVTENLNRMIYLTNMFTFDICEHDNPLQHVEAKEATTSETGNLEYWYCSKCNKYFKNEECTDFYYPNEWIVPKKSSGGGGGSGSGGGGGSVVDPTQPEEPIVDPEEPDTSEVIAAVESTKIQKTKLTVKNRKVKLNWKKLTYDYPTQYTIYRSYKTNKSYKKIKTITNGKNSFTDSKKLKKGKKYYYKIVGKIKIDDKWYKTKSSIKSVKLK